MFFDKEMNLVPEFSGVQRVTEAGSLQKLAVTDQTMPSDGFYYTYVTNTSTQITQFDNVTYIHIEGQLKEANDYYPYGLLCSSATISTVGNYKFQDKEFNRKEFLNSWGLDWYNHGARMYDPELGKWHVQDPALQFANPYIAMGNNPIKYTDPDGRFLDIFFDALEYISPVVIKPDLHFGSEKRGIGFNISIGIPKLIPVSYRKEYGKTYYTKNYDNPAGWETRDGADMTYFGVISITGTTYKSGETSQSTTILKIGGAERNVEYENDWQPKILKSITPKSMHQYMNDDGDRYRTAALRVNRGPVNYGFNIFTGDPGLDPKNRPSDNIGGHDTYVPRDGSDPDKYRAGVAYVGFGGMKIGMSSEKIRHVVQNRFAHDFLSNCKPNWFRQLPEEDNKFFFEFGMGSSSLW